MGLEAEWIRGAGALAVLTLLERRAMYGYELVEALERDSGGLLELGQSTVYPLLYKLEGRGFVRPETRDAPSGRRRKYYHVTPSGRRFLRQQRGQWATLVEALRRLGVPPAGPGEVEVTP
jgi:PadR family transcriptional regulator PadR